MRMRRRGVVVVSGNTYAPIASKNAPGVLITFEGGDGSGKSTHARFLGGVLESLGIDVVSVREPGGTAIGEKLRDVLLDPANGGMSDRTELLVYEAARAQLIDDVIRPALDRGAVVICDRFTDSTMVYQGRGRGIDMDAIARLNDFATCGIEPDITVVFACANREERRERVDKRGERDRLEAEAHDFHRRISEGFDSLSGAEDGRIRRLITSNRHSETARSLFDLLKEVLPFLGDGSVDLTAELDRFDADHHYVPFSSGGVDE